MAIRYTVYARRGPYSEWTVWNSTSSSIEAKGFIKRIRQLGYEARCDELGVSTLDEGGIAHRVQVRRERRRKK